MRCHPDNPVSEQNSKPRCSGFACAERTAAGPVQSVKRERKGGDIALIFVWPLEQYWQIDQVSNTCRWWWEKKGPISGDLHHISLPGLFCWVLPNLEGASFVHFVVVALLNLEADVYSSSACTWAAADPSDRPCDFWLHCVCWQGNQFALPRWWPCWRCNKKSNAGSNSGKRRRKKKTQERTLRVMTF